MSNRLLLVKKCCCDDVPPPEPCWYVAECCPCEDCTGEPIPHVPCDPPLTEDIVFAVGGVCWTVGPDSPQVNAIPPNGVEVTPSDLYLTCDDCCDANPDGCWYHLSPCPECEGGIDNAYVLCTEAGLPDLPICPSGLYTFPQGGDDICYFPDQQVDVLPPGAIIVQPDCFTEGDTCEECCDGIPPGCSHCAPVVHCQNLCADVYSYVLSFTYTPEAIAQAEGLGLDTTATLFSGQLTRQPGDACRYFDVDCYECNPSAIPVKDADNGIDCTRVSCAFFTSFATLICGPQDNPPGDGLAWGFTASWMLVKIGPGNVNTPCCEGVVDANAHLIREVPKCGCPAGEYTISFSGGGVPNLRVESATLQIF